MGCHCKKKCCTICPVGPTGTRGPTGPTGGGGNLTFLDDIGFTVPMAGIINTTGVGGNRTVGDNSNTLTIQDRRSLSPFVVGSNPNTSEFQTIQSALNAASATDIIYLQAGTYTENIVMVNGGVIDGQGVGTATINGTVTIPPGVAVFIKNVMITGTVTNQGQSLLMENVFINTGDAIALAITGGFSMLIHDCIFINVSTIFPTINVVAGAAHFVWDSLIANQVIDPAVKSIVMDPTYGGELVINSCNMGGGLTLYPHVVIQDSNCSGSSGNGTIDLIHNGASNNRKIFFLRNRVNIPDFNVTCDGTAGVNGNAEVQINGNFFENTDINITVQNVIGSAVNSPFVLVSNNTLLFSSVTIEFINNTPRTLVELINNFHQGNGISSSTTSGTEGRVTVKDSTLLGAGLGFTDILFVVLGNEISFASGPITFNVSLATALNLHVENNWLSTDPPSGANMLNGSLSNAAHILNMSNNTFVGDGVTNLFSIALAGGATFVSNGVNGNTTSNPVGTAPGAMPIV